MLVIMNTCTSRYSYLLKYFLFKFKLKNEWIDYYLTRGINLLLWNYRGYGRSTGKPTPNRLMKDGEILVDYLRANYNVKKIGVHGESLGGMVASHIAKAKNLEFLCADRTFSSLTDVAFAGFGRFLYSIYLVVTGWTNDSSDSYIDSNCYKILTFDPRDEVIPISGSLRSGVTRKIIERGLGIKKQYFSLFKQMNWSYVSPKNYFLLLKRIISVSHSEFRRLLHQSRIEKYNELLTEEQMRILFEAISRISMIFLEMSKTQNLNAKRHRRSSSTEQTPRVDVKTGRMLPRKSSTGKNGRGGSVDSSINFMKKTKNLTDETFEITDETGIGMMKISKEEQNVSYYNNDSRIYNQNTLDHKTFIFDDKDILLYINKQPYFQLLDEETKKSDEFTGFILKVNIIYSKVIYIRYLDIFYI